MPLFYTPKPRQFSYRPRFYDPEKERWEALKQKYADERTLRELQEEADNIAISDSTAETIENSDEELQYFQNRVRELDREERKANRELTWKDLFRKREMPKFNYQPRFQTEENQDNQGVGEHIAEFKKRSVKIKRRFDVTDPDYMKPVPATRIMLYTLLVCMLLYWILF